MKTIYSDVTDWLQRTAHALIGRPFEVDDCSCVPVLREAEATKGAEPLGFLVARGENLTYMPAPPAGQEDADWLHLVSEWAKRQLTVMETTPSLPAEYWYG